MKIRYKSDDTYKFAYTYARYALIILWMCMATFSRAQITNAYSFSSAFSVLNTSNVVSSPVTYTSNISSGILDKAPVITRRQDYNKKWIISFGIPIQVSLDYSYLRARMVTAYEENPYPYDNGSPAFREAVDILGWAGFATISSWAPVRCQLYFRYVLPQLGIQESNKFKYSNQYDPLAAPVKGSTTFWIR